MPSSHSVLVEPAARVRGRVRPPGDKSISHRYALVSAMAEGVTTINGYSTGGDCASTLGCLRSLGVTIEHIGRDARGLRVTVAGRGPRGLLAPSTVLDAGNSGSTMRMLAGILAAHPFRASMTGDDSLRRRPMRRIIVRSRHGRPYPPATAGLRSRSKARQRLRPSISSRTCRARK